MATFQELFSGSDKTHGHWSQESGYETQPGPASEQDYQDHLTGTRGLGLVPVRPDGTCIFGALDIDVDTIDHQALYAKVSSRNLPLNVCRSKSGGAHLYVFFDRPYKATLVQQLLKRWAGSLGYPKCEIFPKQVKIDTKNLGNWINLPYFGGDSTTRYCVGAEGALSLQDFLEKVRFYDPNDKVVEIESIDDDVVSKMPPCLNILTNKGLPEGVRNQGMFNFAVFYRKSSPNGWEEKIKEHNEKYCKPPLEAKELASLIKSVGKTKYQYTCKQEPICSRCDKTTCKTLEFGIGHMPWQETGSFDDFQMSRIRKINTRPPRYKVEVNGTDVELGTDEIRNFSTGFKKKIFEELNLVLAPMKQDHWDQILRTELEHLEIIEAPPDASIHGMVLIKVLEFVGLCERSKKVEDILKGLPFNDEGTVIFRSVDLQKFLQSARFTVETQILYQLMIAEGGAYKKMTIKGRDVMVWSLPWVAGHTQTEGFDTPEFEKTGEGI
jgi:hypothetical protein